MISEDAATVVRLRVHTPVQAARIVGRRLGMPEGSHPNRKTVRAWAFRWCERGTHYVILPRGMMIYPEGLEKILAELAELA